MKFFKKTYLFDKLFMDDFIIRLKCLKKKKRKLNVNNRIILF